MPTSSTLVKTEERIRFRGSVARGIAGGVVRGANAIRGFAIATKGEARGHEVEIDDTTLNQIVKLGNQRKQGLKSRFGHPNMSSDALGTYLGRVTHFRRDGDVVRADLQLDETAFDTPNGDLGNYVLNLGESDPKAFGSSIVFRGHEEKRLNKDGTPKKDGDGNELLPLARIDELHAVDVVDTPAANEGLFSGTSAQFSAEMTEFLDKLLSRKDAVEKVISFLERFAENREGQVAHNEELVDDNSVKESDMSKDKDAKTSDEATFTQADLDAAVEKATTSALEKFTAQRKAAIKADRRRCAKIDSAAAKLGTKKELVQKAKDEGWSLEESMTQFIDAFEAKKVEKLSELTKDDAAEGIASSGIDVADSAASIFNEGDEPFDKEAWEKAWETDATLRKRWSGMKKEFLAYGKNKGKVRVKLDG